MPPFRPRRDDELNGWSDDDLIAHIRAARAAGDRKQARRALQILVFGHHPNITRRVSLKVPSEDVELVAGAAFESAFTSAFDGRSVGEFHSWLQTIVARRIADYHRRDGLAGSSSSSRTGRRIRASSRSRPAAPSIKRSASSATSTSP